MDNQQQDRSAQPGYHTPGSDRVVESSSPAVPSPSEPSEGRIHDPKPVIESIGETPGDANPALVETVGAQQGRVSTADELLARETAEEERLRAARAHIYEEQGINNTLGPLGDTASDQSPAQPIDRREDTSANTLDAPHVEDSFRTQAELENVGQLQGRADRTLDRASQATAETEAKVGLPSVGGESAEADKYQRRELQTPYPTPEIDEVAPGMTNISDETKNG